MFDARAYAATSATSPLAPHTIQRRQPTERDVRIDILFCGICHSDLHSVRDEWKEFMPTEYPIVPGHEIVGRVAEVGAQVSKHKVGDLVAVGCLVDADLSCPHCKSGHENYCPEQVYTFNGPDKHTGGVTYGGYSDSIVVDEHFVLRVPENLDLAGVAPLLCAGITTYSPLKRWGVREGKRVGVVGLGGLGHMAVKISRALGAHTTVFTRSADKVEDALRLGANDGVISSDAAEMEKRMGSYDFILDTVSAKHPLDPYLNLLAPEGTMTLVGAPNEPLEMSAFGLLMGSRNLTGSIIGGLPETQEVLDFCGEHNITADIELISIQEINEAYERLEKSDVKYRFVIDMASIRKN
jgi:uncharacterized zinc-type alcohol dehydrogenase-like protein